MIEKVLYPLLFLLFTLLSDVDTLASHKWGTTSLQVETLKYSWTIQNFNATRLSSQSYLISPEFWVTNQQDYKWRLQLHRDNDYLSVYLQSRTNTRVKVLFTISIGSFARSSTNTFTLDGTDGFSRIMYINQLYKAKNRYDDTVVVQCEIQRLIGEKNSTRQCQGAANKKSAETELADDMEVLLDQELFTDITLAVDNSEIRAHKAILAARSSVFRKLLTGELSKGNTSSVVTVTDVESRVFKELLRYVYVGKVEHIEKIARKLLAAAHKYEIKGLKALCEEYLCKDLNDDNAMEILSLANENEAHVLSTEAANFIASHGSSVIHSAEFKSMERKLRNPLFDIFRAYFEN